MIILVMYSCLNYAPTWIFAMLSQFIGQVICSLIILFSYREKVGVSGLIVPIVNLNVSLSFGPLVYYSMERAIRINVFHNWQQGEELKN